MDSIKNQIIPNIVKCLKYNEYPDPEITYSSPSTVISRDKNRVAVFVVFNNTEKTITSIVRAMEGYKKGVPCYGLPKDLTELVLVLADTVSVHDQDLAKIYSDTYGGKILHHHHFCFEMVKSEIYCKHEVVTENISVVEKYEKLNLPLINFGDAGLAWVLGVRVGNIIKITNLSLLVGESIVYRKVVLHM